MLPIFTLLLSKLFLNQQHSLLAYISLLPIISGVFGDGGGAAHSCKARALWSQKRREGELVCAFEALFRPLLTSTWSSL